MKKIEIKSSFGKKKPVPEKVEYRSETPDITSDCEDEMNYIHKQFGEAKKKEIESANEQTSTAYHTVIFFKTKAQKEQFYQNAKISELVDPSGRFINGEELAKALNIQLDKVNFKAKTEFKQGKRFNNDKEFSYI